MTDEYHKIQTIFKRDLSQKRKPLIEGDWTQPEFQFLANNTWQFTEKVNGTNIRVMFDGKASTFGGRTDAAQIPAKLFVRLNERFFPLKDRLVKVFGDESGVVLYGEGYGAGIQRGGGDYRSDQDFVLFDVRVGDWWLQRHDVEDVAQKLGLDVVPVIGEGTLYDAISMVKSDRFTSCWGNFEAEGIVARPKTELFTRGGTRIITKIKCRDFRYE